MTTRPDEIGDAAEDLAFIEQIVLSRTGDDAQRKRMRTLLRRVVDRKQGTWREAWARVAIGRSLALEDDETSRALGVIELLHVPARFSSEQPALAALALRDAAGALRALGDSAGARELLEQLPEIDPTRPAPAPRPSSTHVAADSSGPSALHLNVSRSADRP